MVFCCVYSYNIRFVHIPPCSKATVRISHMKLRNNTYGFVFNTAANIYMFDSTLGWIT